MVTEAGGDTRWSGSTQIIYPGSSLSRSWSELVLGAPERGAGHPEARPLAPVTCAWWERLVLGHGVCLYTGGGVGVGYIAASVL